MPSRNEDPQVPARAPAVGDVVRYYGSLNEYRGTVWEVTVADERGLRLFDLDRALANVSPDSVTVMGTT